MKPRTPANKVKFYAKTRFFPFFPLFDNISEVFQPILLLEVALWSRYSNEQFLFFLKKKKSNVLCFNDFTTKNVQKWKISYNLQTVPPIFTFEVGKCSRKSLNQLQTCVVLPVFGFAKLVAIVCIYNTQDVWFSASFKEISKQLTGSPARC